MPTFIATDGSAYEYVPCADAGCLVHHATDSEIDAALSAATTDLTNEGESRCT